LKSSISFGDEQFLKKTSPWIYEDKESGESDVSRGAKAPKNVLKKRISVLLKSSISLSATIFNETF
jgi:hypothetical protein